MNILTKFLKYLSLVLRLISRLLIPLLFIIGGVYREITGFQTEGFKLARFLNDFCLITSAIYFLFLIYGHKTKLFEKLFNDKKLSNLMWTWLTFTIVINIITWIIINTK